MDLQTRLPEEGNGDPFSAQPLTWAALGLLRTQRGDLLTKYSYLTLGEEAFILT